MADGPSDLRLSTKSLSVSRISKPINLPTTSFPTLILEKSGKSGEVSGNKNREKPGTKPPTLRKSVLSTGLVLPVNVKPLKPAVVSRVGH